MKYFDKLQMINFETRETEIAPLAIHRLINVIVKLADFSAEKIYVTRSKK